MIKNKVDPAAAEGEGSCGGGGTAGGEDALLFARLGARGECEAADGSACWHLAAGASTIFGWLSFGLGAKTPGREKSRPCALLRCTSLSCRTLGSALDQSTS